MSLALKLAVVIGILGALAFGAWQLTERHDQVAEAVDAGSRQPSSVGLGKTNLETQAEDPEVRALIEARAVEVTAAKLVVDYRSNEVAAETDYRNKVIEVRGVIDRIAAARGDSLPIITLLGDSGGFVKVFCAYTGDVGALLSLRRGQTVWLRGIGAGQTPEGPAIRRCWVKQWLP